MQMCEYDIYRYKNDKRVKQVRKNADLFLKKSKNKEINMKHRGVIPQILMYLLK